MERLSGRARVARTCRFPVAPGCRRKKRALDCRYCGNCGCWDRRGSEIPFKDRGASRGGWHGFLFTTESAEGAEFFWLGGLPRLTVGVSPVIIEVRCALYLWGLPLSRSPSWKPWLKRRDVEVRGVVTPPDRPGGRGRNPVQSPVKSHALAQGLRVFQPQSLRPEAAQIALAALSPDVFVVAAYGRILPPPVLALPPHGCLNLHPSLLPRHRGPAPVVTAILEGDRTTGVTLMQLNPGDGHRAANLQPPR